MAEVAKLETKPEQEEKPGADWGPIAKVLPLITGAVTPIAKKRENKQQGYAFRGVDDVYAVLNLLLEKYGVTIIPEVIDAHRESYQTKSGTTMFKCILRVKYSLIASDASHLSCIVEGEGMDSGDKSTQKALSMAYKYMAFQIFCIPTGEKIDTEEDSPEVVGPAQKPAPKPAPHTKSPALEGAAAQAAGEESEADRIRSGAEEGNPDDAAAPLLKRCTEGFANPFEHGNWWKKHTPEINALPRDLQKLVVNAWRQAAPKAEAPGAP